MLRAGAGDGAQQAWPVGEVGHHKATVHAAPPAPSAHLHPPAGKGVDRIGAETLHPRRALGRRWCNDQSTFERRLVQRGIGHAVGVRQGHAGRAVHGVERLHRAMHNDRADAGIHTAQQALSLAERVAEDHRRTALRGIAPPPRIDLVKQRGLGGPAVDGQAKGGLGDEGVAAHRLEGRAGAVGLGFVVARGDPHLPTMFEPHLGRPQHMACGMQ